MEPADLLASDIESLLASPTGRSRYGRRQKSKITDDFYSIDTSLAKAASKRFGGNSSSPGKQLPITFATSNHQFDEVICVGPAESGVAIEKQISDNIKASSELSLPDLQSDKSVCEGHLSESSVEEKDSGADPALAEPVSDNIQSPSEYLLLVVTVTHACLYECFK